MIELRRAIAGDEGLWLSAVSSVLSEVPEDTGSATVEQISSALEDARCYLFVALSAGAPVGLLSAYAVPDLVSGGCIVYLYDIEVARTKRRTGIGGRLEHTGGELVGEQYAEYEWKFS